MPIDIHTHLDICLNMYTNIHTQIKYVYHIHYSDGRSCTYPYTYTKVHTYWHQLPSPNSLPNVHRYRPTQAATQHSVPIQTYAYICTQIYTYRQTMYTTYMMVMVGIAPTHIHTQKCIHMALAAITNIFLPQLCMQAPTYIYICR